MAVPDPEHEAVPKTANYTYIPINPPPAYLGAHDEVLLVESFKRNQAILEREGEEYAARKRRNKKIVQIVILVITLVLIAIGVGVGVNVKFVRA